MSLRMSIPFIYTVPEVGGNRPVKMDLNQWEREGLDLTHRLEEELYVRMDQVRVRVPCSRTLTGRLETLGFEPGTFQRGVMLSNFQITMHLN